MPAGDWWGGGALLSYSDCIMMQLSVLQRPIKRNVLWLALLIAQCSLPFLARTLVLALRSMQQFFMGRIQAKIMFSYSRVRNLLGQWAENK